MREVPESQEDRKTEFSALAHIVAGFLRCNEDRSYHLLHRKKAHSAAGLVEEVHLEELRSSAVHHIVHLVGRHIVRLVAHRTVRLAVGRIVDRTADHTADHLGAVDCIAVVARIGSDPVRRKAALLMAVRTLARMEEV